MTDEDGFRIEAAEQFGFSQAEDDGSYICTEAQLIAFAKAAERKGLAVAATIATSELRNVSMLMSNPMQSSAAWDIRNAITKRVEDIDAENRPILAAEEERFMTSRGYVRGTEEPGKRCVRPEPLCDDEGCPHHGTPHVCVSEKSIQISDCEVCGGDCAAANPPVMNCPNQRPV